MNVQDEVGYPTQGDVIRFLFNVTGVLPEKRDRTPLDDKRRAAIRKVLQRLASEAGELEDNFADVVAQLSELLGGYLELEPVRSAADEVLAAVLAAYRDCVRNIGTYLSKGETLRWVARDVWVPAVADAIARAVTRYNLRPLASWLPPGGDWFLPRPRSAGAITPLGSVMQWIYDRAGVTATEFHYPDRTADEHDVARRQALENAQHWRLGQHLPSAAALRWTFERALVASSPDADVALASAVKQIALFVSRGATALGQALEEAFGATFLQELTGHFERRLLLALHDGQAIERHIHQLAPDKASVLDFDLRSFAIEVAEHDLADRKRRIADELAHLAPGTAPDDAMIERLAKLHGDYVVADLHARPRLHEIPPGFGELLVEGRGLWKAASLRPADVDRYERRLADTSIDARLPWMAPWLRFLICYRAEDYEAAWPWVAQAYELARYRAGSDQYRIVNHYIELAAKKCDRVAFRNGINWARYLDIEVRWLRDLDPTTENLDFVREILGRARYGV